MGDINLFPKKIIIYRTSFSYACKAARDMIK